MNSKKTVFQRGVLENAGLGEIAYFLKKAKQNIDFARFSLQNTDFSESAAVFDTVSSRATAMDTLLVEMRDEIDRVSVVILDTAREAEQRESESTEE